MAPTALPALVALAGLMLLVSAATPADPDRFRWLAQLFPAAVIDASHFTSSIIGLLLLLMAFGLSRRVGAAWGASASLLLLGALLALLKGVDWEETAALAVVWLLVLPARKAFFRKAELTALEVTPVWLVSALAVVLGAFVLTFWSYSSLRIYDQLWWRLIGDADSARSLRAATGAALALMAIGVWRLFATPHTPKIIGDDDPDFVRVRAILANADEPDPEAQLALLGDKRFLFSRSGQSFLMFGVRGRSWIALGAPVGRRSERLELLWRFRELADAHAARKGVYGIGPDLLPDLVEMGLSIQKIGESAAVPLETFSTAGRRREVLRRNWRRVQELGASFEVVNPAQTAELIPELKALSDQWLTHHAGGDKSFTMGGFDPRYVAEFPCALVRMEGAVVAFASLWTTPDQSSFSMDLMRYGDGAPKNVMDFLFVELLLWGQAQGYGAFELGMAPLAGLEERRLAPFLSRVGRLVFERGEDFYNFQGLRRYKDKYSPVWEPRYIAAPNKWSIPLLMADVGLLSSGGVAGLGRRPKRPAASEPAGSEPIGQNSPGVLGPARAGLLSTR
jgi:phosphatidylglycerol lysyltransferase